MIECKCGWEGPENGAGKVYSGGRPVFFCPQCKSIDLARGKECSDVEFLCRQIVFLSNNYTVDTDEFLPGRFVEIFNDCVKIANRILDGEKNADA